MLYWIGTCSGTIKTRSGRLPPGGQRGQLLRVAIGGLQDRIERCPEALLEFLPVLVLIAGGRRGQIGDQESRDLALRGHGVNRLEGSGQLRVKRRARPATAREQPIGGRRPRRKRRWRRRAWRSPPGRSWQPHRYRRSGQRSGRRSGRRSALWSRARMSRVAAVPPQAARERGCRGERQGQGGGAQEGASPHTWLPCVGRAIGPVLCHAVQLLHLRSQSPHLSTILHPEAGYEAHSCAGPARPPRDSGAGYVNQGRSSARTKSVRFDLPGRINS